MSNEELSKSNEIEYIQTTQTAEPLSWGKSYLMCPPDYFGVFYEINPWMHIDVAPDKDLAQKQWHNLVDNLKKAGATIHTMEAVEGLPDIVFTANAGLVDGKTFIPSTFKSLERRPEVIYDNAWFQAHDFEVSEFTDNPELYFEGCGDAFIVRNQLVAGYGFRSELASHAVLARKLGVDVFSVHLVDPRLYHLDISFCPLDSQHAIIAPDVWSRESVQGILKLVPEPLMLELDEALTFCANSVVVGKNIVMPHCPARVGRILNKWGYEVCESPVTEFLKAGGGARCLTLALDVSYQQGRARASATELHETRAQ